MFSVLCLSYYCYYNYVISIGRLLCSCHIGMTVIINNMMFFILRDSGLEFAGALKQKDARTEADNN